MSRERYSKQFTWYQSLAETERSRLDYICNEILYRAGQALMDLNGETLLRKALTTEEDSTKFYQEEQKKLLNQALARPLQNQVELSDLLKSILYEIRAGEICTADLYYLKVDNPESSRSKVDPWSFKWFEPAVEVASYLIYVAQIEHIVRSGILESNRRPEIGSGYSINEILQLLARQIIISVGGIDECFFGKLRSDPKGKELRLSDVLVDKTSPEEVKKLYKKFLDGEKPKVADLTKFLRHLSDKGYYSKKLIDRDYAAVGKNDFMQDFKIHRTNPYIPPKEGDEAWNHPPYTNIPDLR